MTLTPWLYLKPAVKRATKSVSLFDIVGDGEARLKSEPNFRVGSNPGDRGPGRNIRKVRWARVGHKMR